MGQGVSRAFADRRKTVNLVNGTSGRVARVLYLDDAPRDFGLEVAFSLSVLSLQIPGLSDRQGGIEMSAPRPCATDPFLTKLSSARFAQYPNKLLHVFESENSFLFHMAHTALTLVQNKRNAGMDIC